MALIEARDIHKQYQSGEVQAKALNGVSLNIEEGAFTVLAGPSGSGKTTLLNIIGTLDRPDSGSLQVAASDVLGFSLAECADFRLHHIGFVFQAYNLIRVLTARENVAYVQQLQGVAAGERNRIADHLLAEVGLAGLENRRPDQLSGGQQQRIAVARALAASPNIVLADEPTANLDSHTGESLMQLMQTLNETRGTTFLISSHDPLVMKYAKCVVHLRDGRIAEDAAI
ncbi:MAG: ABC transporter ATP-binding protein [Mariprofundaceae bacterium]